MSARCCVLLKLACWSWWREGKMQDARVRIRNAKWVSYIHSPHTPSGSQSRLLLETGDCSAAADAFIKDFYRALDGRSDVASWYSPQAKVSWNGTLVPFDKIAAFVEVCIVVPFLLHLKQQTSKLAVPPPLLPRNPILGCPPRPS